MDFTKYVWKEMLYKVNIIRWMENNNNNFFNN